MYLPYVVLCELERLKMNSSVARNAISYIDKCIKAKDEYLSCQSVEEMKTAREFLELDNGDDHVINCGLQLLEFSDQIMVMSNDADLRNKAKSYGLPTSSACWE
jgi:rRNA-processing protein FCF1